MPSLGLQPRARPYLPFSQIQSSLLGPEELDTIREQIECDHEIHGIVERNFAHLLAKLPPKDESE